MGACCSNNDPANNEISLVPPENLKDIKLKEGGSHDEVSKGNEK